MRSPCLNCEHLTESKDNERCQNCPDRIRYAIECGDLPKDVLNTLDESQPGKEPREKIVEPRNKEKEDSSPSVKLCKECHKEPATIKDMCKKCYMRNYMRGRKKEDKSMAKKVSPKIEDENEENTFSDSRMTVKVNFAMPYKQLYLDLQEIAEKELRPINNMALYFIVHGIERYKTGKQNA